MHFNFTRAAASGLLIFVYSSSIPAQIIIKPSPGSEYYIKAEALREAGKNEEALEAVNEAIRLNPKGGSAYGLRSGILGNLGQHPEGIADADLAMKLATSNRAKAAAASNKGFNLTQMGRKREALEAYRLALQFDPRFAMAHFGRGKLFYFLGMWKEAHSALKRALDLDDYIGAAWAYLAEVQYRLGEVEDGFESAQKAVELSPQDPRSFRARAIGYQLKEQYEEMLADATQAVEIDPTRPRAHLLRGRALAFLGQMDEALAEYAMEPDHDAVAPYLGKAHQQMYGSRMNNCGDTSTSFELPGGQRIDTFEDCRKRVMEELQESATPSASAPKKSVPNLPSRRRAAK